MLAKNLAMDELATLDALDATLSGHDEGFSLFFPIVFHILLIVIYCNFLI